jgi:hypothetical protein
MLLFSIWVIPGLLLCIKVLYDEWKAGTDLTLLAFISCPIFFGGLGIFGVIIWILLHIDDYNFPVIIKGRKQ